MELGEFVRRARASRLSKKSRFDDAFERVRRELRLLDAKPALPTSPTVGFSRRWKSDRAVLSLARQDRARPQRKEA
jgi:hypothetical protein